MHTPAEIALNHSRATGVRRVLVVAIAILDTGAGVPRRSLLRAARVLPSELSVALWDLTRSEEIEEIQPGRYRLAITCPKECRAE